MPNRFDQLLSSRVGARDGGTANRDCFARAGSARMLAEVGDERSPVHSLHRGRRRRQTVPRMDRSDDCAKYFSSAAGLISSVVDYATFDIALDEYRLVSEETQELAWTPFVSTRGRDL